MVLEEFVKEIASILDVRSTLLGALARWGEEAVQSGAPGTVGIDDGIDGDYDFSAGGGVDLGGVDEAPSTSSPITVDVDGTAVKA